MATTPIQDALLSPEAFAGVAATHVERIQTHISWVFLLDRDVYKLKRPVELGFLDFRSIEKRKRACEAEVELNRRLAPNVYLGVVPIGQTPDGSFHVNGPGQVVDWAVHMVRLSEACRADKLLERGELSLLQLDAIAQCLAEFHRQSASGPEISAWGSADHVAQNIRENFAQTRDTIQQFLSGREAAELENWQRDCVRDRAELFHDRAARRRVRDGHGDLRLEHVYVEASGITVLDCIEFNDRFRYADVCADIAFLSMDLEALGRVDLAEFLLARYARHANDFELYGLVDFYESYRAFVRAKVAAFNLADAAAEHLTRELALKQARRYALLALSSARESITSPILVAVGGTIASGKSTLAEQLGIELSAPIIDTDRVRKHLAGRGALDPVHDLPFQGIYSVEMSKRVHDELSRRALSVLGSGRPVIVEASFRTVEQRASIRALAKEHKVPFHFIECRAPAEVCKRRLSERAQGPSVSDGRLGMFDAFMSSFEAVNELAAAEHIVLDTTHSLALNMVELRRLIGFGVVPPT